jgi:hypothetical protein
MDAKEDPAVRLAASKALAKSPYKHDPIDAMIKTISSITNKDRELFKFGADVTVVLELKAGEQFSRTKETPMLWQGWWGENREKLKKEDEKKRAEQGKGGEGG